MRYLIIILLLVSISAQAQTDPAATLWEQYQNGKFDEVANQGKALLNTGTESAQINLAVGRALTDLERTEEAMPYLGRAAKGDVGRTWVYAWAEVYLGVCQARLDNLEQAKDAWQKARDCGATANATRNATGNLKLFGLDESFDDWVHLETEHIAFSFSPRLGIFDREDFANTREEAYGAISTWFGGGPVKKIRFFVWADPAEAKVAGLPTLGFSRPEFRLIHAFAAQTRGHELTHVISDQAMAPAVKTGLINEGSAVFHDQTGRDTMARARAAVDQGSIGDGESPFVRVELRALWEDFDLLTDEYSYPVAGAFVDRLIQRGGNEKFLAFFPDQSYAHAKVVYGEDLEGWIDAFETDLYQKK